MADLARTIDEEGRSIWNRTTEKKERRRKRSSEENGKGSLLFRTDDEDVLKQKQDEVEETPKKRGEAIYLSEGKSKNKSF
jgi:hypothetical protein